MNNLNVLYVEDNQDTREMTLLLLEGLCQKVYSGTNGAEGLELFKQHKIDVVLTDITMPELDGLDMSMAIKKLNANIPIVIFSAYSEPEYLFKAIEMGVSNYLMKPIQTPKLEKILKKIAQTKHEKEQLKHYKQELEEMNANLKEMVTKEIEKNKLQDTILFSQSKTAQMGEMLSMIAHQWRQPLNIISAAAIKLEIQNNLSQLEQDSTNKMLQLIQAQTQSLSKTIDDFMNFFKADAHKELFTINKLFENITSIVDAQIKSHKISLEFIGENIEIFTYEKELSHVLLNFISNSRDAFEGKEKPRTIQLSVLQNEHTTTILFQDNAGGIEEDKIERVFDAYFTTKEQGKGTGIGLYMSKRIVNEILQGEISVENKHNGCVFKISIPNRK